MIVCPNCNHQNPEGASQCEACYTPLPATTNCPTCGAVIQTDANFCGQCGSHVQLSPAPPSATSPNLAVAPSSSQPESPFIPVEPIATHPQIVLEARSTESNNTISAPFTEPEIEHETVKQPIHVPPLPSGEGSKTQLQQQTAQLIHIRSNTTIELPSNLPVIHIGKPNDRIPPDIDVSGFSDSEVISRIHADIRLEGDAYYIEDVGSSNGTYINNIPLLKGNRHRLRPGDRVALGKGDRVTFLFQIA